MIQNSPDLDQVFAALADPTRRAILARLGSGEASVTDLARPFGISQPAISRHLRVLEAAGLIETRIDGTARPRSLRALPLREASDWLGGFARFWSDRFDRLDALLAETPPPPSAPPERSLE